MVVCKYFLQGTCRFGENCKFEHQINNDRTYTNPSSILLQNQTNKPATNVDTTTLVKAVVNDMTMAEKGGQWLLSSYAPFKEKPAFPGFEDYSMEEIRYLFHEAVKNGTLEQYKQNLQMMLQQAVMKIKALQNPTPEAINMLKNIYNTPPSSSFSNNQTQFGGSVGGTSSIFGGAQTKSVFGGSTNSEPGIFGGTNANTTQQSVFGANNSIFAGNQSSNKSMFGGGSTPNFGGQTKSIFGSSQPTPASNSIFGTPPTQNSNSQPVFGNQSSPLFGGGSPNPQQNIFQQSTTTNQFGGAVPNTTIFGGQQQTPFGGPQNQTASPFGTTQSTNTPTQQLNQFSSSQSVFGNPQITITPQNSNQVGASQSVFANPNSQNTSPFGSAQNTLLGTAVPVTGGNKPAFQHTQSIFGNLVPQNTNSAIFGNNNLQEKPDEDFYSKLEDLTEEEIKWFESDDLDIEKIPEKPPTFEMCFKRG